VGEDRPGDHTLPTFGGINNFVTNRIEGADDQGLQPAELRNVLESWRRSAEADPTIRCHILFPLTLGDTEMQRRYR